MLARVRTADVDRLITRSRGGDPVAFGELIPLVYEELHGIAHQHRLRWSGDETLGTTALVHEAYLKLAERTTLDYADRSHLLAVAARAMRQILVDYYRAKQTTKRGGALDHLTFDKAGAVHELVPGLVLAEGETVLLLDRALLRLAAESERHAQIIDCRYFAGLTIEETARALGISVATVKRGAAVARAYLARELGAPRPSESDAE